MSFAMTENIIFYEYRKNSHENIHAKVLFQ